MSRSIARLTLVVFVTLLALLCACTDSPVDSVSRRFEATEQFSSALDASELNMLLVEGVNGNVIITGTSDSDSVRIGAEKVVRSESTADAQNHLQSLHVDVLVSGSAISVKTAQPISTEGRDYIVNYEIVVPKDFRVTVANVNGNVTVDSISNSVSVVLVNGQVALKEIVGSATVAVTNGRIDSNMMLPLNGSATSTVVNGDINLSIPRTTSAGFSANVVNGTISVSNLDIENQQNTQHSIVGILGDGDGTIALAVTNGSIAVTGL